MNIQLMQNYFIVENPLWQPEKLASGIVIPEASRNKKKSEEEMAEDFKKLCRLKVLKASEHCTKVKENDEVFINSNILLQGGGIKVELEGKGYVIFQESNIVFIY